MKTVRSTKQVTSTPSDDTRPKTSLSSEQSFHFVHRRKRNHFWYWRNYRKSFVFPLFCSLYTVIFSKKNFFSSWYKWLQRTRVYPVLPEASVAKLMFTTGNISVAQSSPPNLRLLTDDSVSHAVCCWNRNRRRGEWKPEKPSAHSPKAEVWRPLWWGPSCSTMTRQADGYVLRKPRERWADSFLLFLC